MIKLLCLYVIRFLLSPLKIFPVRKRQCFFESYMGSQYSCNPKALYEYLSSHFSGMTFVWSAKGDLNIPESENNRLLFVHPKSFSYFFELIRSKYVFTNIELPTYIPKHKSSVWVNTWHGGGAFKRVEYPASNLYSKVTKKIQCRQTDCYISSSKKFTEVMQKSTGLPIEKFLEIGMPRNDIFFGDENIKEKINKKVRSFYNIPESAFVVLYAPTYRGNVRNADFDMILDIHRAKEAFEKRFEKKCVFLVRSHHALKSLHVTEKNILDVTSYPDMQDLLLAADALITDYSSCIYDFALTRKPGFLFVPDLEEYRKSRGLYTDVSDWAFPFAKNNEDFEKLILHFDANENERKIDKYLESLGAFDCGNAIAKLLTTIMENI